MEPPHRPRAGSWRLGRAVEAFEGYWASATPLDADWLGTYAARARLSKPRALPKGGRVDRRRLRADGGKTYVDGVRWFVKPGTKSSRCVG